MPENMKESENMSNSDNYNRDSEINRSDSHKNITNDYTNKSYINHDDDFTISPKSDHDTKHSDLEKGKTDHTSTNDDQNTQKNNLSAKEFFVKYAYQVRRFYK